MNARRRRLREGVDVATAWLGTDIVRAAVIPPGAGWVVPVEDLDDHPDDPGALAAFLRRVHDDTTHPYPRLVAMRWANHYTALILPAATGSPVLYNPHHGAEPAAAPRPYPSPPLRILRKYLGDRPVHYITPPRPNQSERADTLCVVWTTMFLAGHWRPDMTLPDAWNYLKRCLRSEKQDFLAYAQADCGYSRASAKQLHTLLVGASIQQFRTACG